MSYLEEELNSQDQEEGEGKWLKRISIFLLFLIAVLAAFGAGMYMSQKSEVLGELAKKEHVYAGKVLGKYSGSEKDLGGNVKFDLYWEVWDTLHEKYVDKENIKEKELFYGSLEGMVEAMGDPYTTFMNPKEAKEFQESMSETSFEGIGAEISIRDNMLTVVAPLDGRPADKAGLQPGDKILAIDGTSTANISLDEAVQRIRGEKGTDVTLTIARDSFEAPQDISVTRGKIVVESVRTKMKDGVYVIEITNFKNNTVGLFHEAVREALKKDPEGIVLDVRNNPGGYLQGAVAVASEWVENGNVVIEDFGNGEKKEYEAEGRARLKDYNTTVLINKGSASASEIVAGALQDHGEATIVGEQSFGKGSVQTLERFSNNASVKISVARWLTPDGSTIEGEGITPDVKVKMTEEDYKEVNDPQLKRAIKIIKNPSLPKEDEEATTTAATSTPEKE